MDLDTFVDAYRRERGLESFAGDYWIEYMVDSLYRFRHVLSWLPPQERAIDILDIGTTPFTWFLALSRPGSRVSTIDRTVERFEAECKRRSVCFEVCDLERDPLPFQNESFDVIVFDAVLEHIFAPPSEIFREIKRVLRPNGELVVGVPNMARLLNRMRLLIGITPLKDPDQQMRRTGVRAHIHEYTMGELVGLLRRCGFTVSEKVYVQPQLRDALRYPQLTQRLKRWFPVFALGCAIPSLRLVIYVRCSK